MKFIIGKKIGMTRVFDDEGRSFAVTKISALPCRVSAILDTEKNGYKAIKVTAFKQKGKKEKIVREAEFSENNIKKYEIGSVVTTKNFKKNEVVTVEGISKGKGFAGTIKRHGFSRGPETHGSKNIRKPGSIGGGYPERVVLGKKMAGRLGGKHVTVKNLRIIDVDDEMLLLSGAIPGPNKSIIKIYGRGEQAEEVVDFAAEEERIAQEKMLEAEKESKEEDNSKLEAKDVVKEIDEEKKEAAGDNKQES